MDREKELVVVAMSGGVDSSVAALLVHGEGRRSLGVSMQVWDYRNNGGCRTRASCCAPDDFTDARRVAARIGIPYYVFDFEKTFRKEVIDKFVRTYEEGQTPNPCVDCNNKVKFRELRERARALGCSHVATGHYARIVYDESGSPHLARGSDREKDQSYFLYGISREELESTIFPVGHLKKDVVREIAREAGLVTASKPESQDICFVSGSVHDFVSSIGIRKKPGRLADRDGNVLGSHDGIHRFTVGQRRGLNLGGAAEPLYVIGIDAVSSTVTVGKREELERDYFSVEEVSWLIERPTVPLDVIVQVRHRHQGVPATISPGDGETITVAFKSEWTPVSPGQAAVFYNTDNERVFGGGRIVI